MVFVRYKVFGSESYKQQTSTTRSATTQSVNMERWLGGECGSTARCVSTDYIPIRECSRSIERQITETLQASFANCGLNTEAELLLAKAGKFET